MDYHRSGVIVGGLLITVFMLGVAYLPGPLARFSPWPLALAGVVILSHSWRHLSLEYAAEEARVVAKHPELAAQRPANHPRFREVVIHWHRFPSDTSRRRTQAVFGIGSDTWAQWRDEVVRLGLGHVSDDGRLIVTDNLNRILSTLSD